MELATPGDNDAQVARINGIFKPKMVGYCIVGAGLGLLLFSNQLFFLLCLQNPPKQFICIELSLVYKNHQTIVLY